MRTINCTTSIQALQFSREASPIAFSTPLLCLETSRIWPCRHRPPLPQASPPHRLTTARQTQPGPTKSTASLVQNHEGRFGPPRPNVTIRCGNQGAPFGPLCGTPCRSSSLRYHLFLCKVVAETLSLKVPSGVFVVMKTVSPVKNS